MAQDLPRVFHIRSLDVKIVVFHALVHLEVASAMADEAPSWIQQAVLKRALGLHGRKSCFFFKGISGARH